MSIWEGMGREGNRESVYGDSAHEMQITVGRASGRGRFTVMMAAVTVHIQLLCQVHTSGVQNSEAQEKCLSIKADSLWKESHS